MAAFGEALGEQLLWSIQFFARQLTVSSTKRGLTTCTGYGQDRLSAGKGVLARFKRYLAFGKLCIERRERRESVFDILF